MSGAARKGWLMKAVVWHGKEDVRVDEVPDPRIEEPTDAIIRVTSTAICGSDLHLYSKLGSFMKEGDIIGHEPMGVVEEVGPGVGGQLKSGDRVVVPFNVSCGSCWLCSQGLYSQCDTTQNKAVRKGASLFGYTHLYGAVPGGQAEYLRIPQAQFGPIRLPEELPDERFLYLSDVLPTAWQSVEYANVPKGGTVVVYGLGPIGQMAARIALYRGAARVIGVDLVPERLSMAERHGVETLDASKVDSNTDEIWARTDARGADSVIDAVGMESEASTVEQLLQEMKVKPDRLSALHDALGSVRRGGTISLAGVYLGAFPAFPLGDLFDKQIQIRMGQANVRAWTDKILPLVLDEADPLGVDDLTTHRLPLAEAPGAYEMFQKKQDGCVKVVLKP
jgi:threonine dehydrogenase-like Zn-dependent dehydrogenase